MVQRQLGGGWGIVLALALGALAAACATASPAPPPPPAAADVAPVPPPLPAATAVAEPDAAPRRPSPPRRGMRPIAIEAQGPITGAWIDPRSLSRDDGAITAAIVVNFRESIPIPETGARSRSARFRGEYRCGARRWRALDVRWFARSDARRPVFTEQRERRNFEDVAPGTLPGLFYEAVCAEPGAGAGPAARGR